MDHAKQKVFTTASEHTNRRNRFIETRLTTEDLLALCSKYEELLKLRQQRGSAMAKGHQRFDEARSTERRSRFRKLASNFPGALRELELDETVLQQRLQEVQQTLKGSPAPAWLVAVWLYHRELRSSLEERSKMSPTDRKSLPSPSQRAWEKVGQHLGIRSAAAETVVYPNRR